MKLLMVLDESWRRWRQDVQETGKRATNPTVPGIWINA